MKKFIKNNWFKIITIILLLMIYSATNKIVDLVNTASSNAEDAYYSASDAKDSCDEAQSDCNNAESSCYDAQDYCE